MQRRLHSLCLMDDGVFPLVYGATAQTQLAQLASFAAPPLSAKMLETFSGDLRDVEAIFSGWGMPALDEKLLGRLPGCKIIFHAAGTVRPFVTPDMWRRGIRLTSAADANAVPVSEYTVSAIVFCLKQAFQRMLELREAREVRRYDPTMPGAFGSTVGLLSLSRIGRKVAERLQSLDVRVLAYDPVIDPREAAALHVELCSLEEVFARADVVSCHMPLLKETTGIIGAAHFSAMKPGASFVNTARGDLVREAEMISVLRRRADLFAVLDVVQHEPIAPGSPLLALPNVIVTPHIAGSLGPECQRLGSVMIEEATRYLRGQTLRGEVFAAQLAFSA